MNKILESSPRLSFCTIVKNERENLPRCLDSIKPYVNEMIVVDTGSQDGTPEIALQYGAEVKEFEWCDDFALARNYAISLASGDWILMLDADEELVVNSEKFLDQLTLQSDIIAYSLTYIDVDDQLEAIPYYRISLFRNISELRYVGRFHELLRYVEQDISPNQSSHLKNIKILHYGFCKEQVQQKNLSRNIPILERIRQEEGLSLRLLHCLAEMYRKTQQLEKFKECYAEAFEQLLPDLMAGNQPNPFIFVPALMSNLVIQSIAYKDYETARLLCQRGLEWCPDYPPLNYVAGVTVRTLGFPLGAVAYFEKCIHMGREGSYYKGEPFELVFMRTYPAYELGGVYIDLERPQEALAAFELVLSFDANFTAARQQVEKIREFLASQA